MITDSFPAVPSPIGDAPLTNRRLYPSLALHAQVAHDIGRKIVSGAIAERQALPREAELAVQFGVSRQAVREALKVLGAKGLVTSRRRTGTTVMPRSSWNLLDPDVLAWHPSDRVVPDFMADLVELRRLIEPAAAALAAERADPERLARIKEALDQMRAAGDSVEAFFAADTEYHAAMYAASGNALIDRLSTIIKPVLEMSFVLQATNNPSFKRAVEQHGAVYDAIARHDAEAARRGMEEILTIAHGQIKQMLHDNERKRG
jgi:DNA-binding FadR family transcriptional regulator